MNLMKERLESLKGAAIAGLCLAIAFVVTSLLNASVLSSYFPIFPSHQAEFLSIHWFFNGAVVTFCGLLFGVTYRYIIRTDKNPQLQAGGIMAFGLVRSLTEVETSLNYSTDFLPLLVMGVESIIGFAIAGLILTKAIDIGLIAAFNNRDEGI
ncbi:MAG: hypothetical protein ACFB02_13040 [Mastigocoleus sp.]